MERTLDLPRNPNERSLLSTKDLDPEAAYLERYLYVPKTWVPLDGVRSVLTLVPETMKGQGDAVLAYEELEHHIRVPRSYIKADSFTESGKTVIDSRVKSFPHHEYKSKIKPRNSVQEEAMHIMENSEGGILELACGKGKTVIALETIARLKTWSIVVVNTTSLMNQWIGAAEKFLGYTPGIIQQDKVEWKPLTIAMLQTLSADRFQDAKELQNYGAVFFDEAHHLSAPTFNRACPLFHGRRYGLTATRRRADGMEALYMHHLGPVLYTDLTMQEEPKSFFVRTGLRMDAETKKSITRAGTVNNSLMQGVLAKTPWRNALILELIEDLRAKGRKILVLGHLVEHLSLLHNACPDSGLVVGAVKPDERARVIDAHDVIFGTTKLAAEGLDAPALDTMVVITPFSSEALVQQALGRISRTLDSKKSPEAYFIEDHVKSCTDMMVSVRHYLTDAGLDFQILDYPIHNRAVFKQIAEEIEEPLFF